MALESDREWTSPALFGKALPSVLLQSLFFLAPLLMTFALTFQRTRNYQLDWTWSFDIWAEVFSKLHFWTILLHTLTMAGLCVVICVAVALPIAYAMANRLKRHEHTLTILLTFAFLTDATLKTFGWVLFLEDKGLANFLLQFAGLPVQSISFLFTDWATMLGMVYGLLPFMIFTLYLSLSAIDRSLILAAYDAGAGPFRAFREITLPLAKPGLLAGSLLVFLLAVGVFLEPKVLGGGKSPMMAELIRQTFETRVNWPLGAALTFVLMTVATFVVLLSTRLYDLRRSVMP